MSRAMRCYRTRFVFLRKEERGSAVALRDLVTSGRAQLVISPTPLSNETRGVALSQPVHQTRSTDTSSL